MGGTRSLHAERPLCGWARHQAPYEGAWSSGLDAATRRGLGTTESHVFGRLDTSSSCCSLVFSTFQGVLGGLRSSGEAVPASTKPAGEPLVRTLRRSRSRSHRRPDRRWDPGLRERSMPSRGIGKSSHRLWNEGRTLRGRGPHARLVPRTSGDRRPGFTSQAHTPFTSALPLNLPESQFSRTSPPDSPTAEPKASTGKSGPSRDAPMASTALTASSPSSSSAAQASRCSPCTVDVRASAKPAGEPFFCRTWLTAITKSATRDAPVPISRELSGLACELKVCLT